MPEQPSLVLWYLGAPASDQGLQRLRDPCTQLLRAVSAYV
jgi:hypothetical protein